MQKTMVVIPAYEPDKKIETLVQALIGRIPVLVVDDGSGGAYTGIFQAIEDMGAIVLHHTQNRGKGAALKTAFEYLQKIGANAHVVTADADGQHSVEDILMIASALRQYAGTVILGGRDVSQMPFRSRFGNTITRSVFRLLTGSEISDTQTGLRGIPANLIGKMMTVVGERYEYEMNMLLALKKWDISFVELPIQTIYLDGNRSSHFHPLRDGLRVFVQLFRYTFISLMCALLDYGLYCLLIKMLCRMELRHSKGIQRLSQLPVESAHGFSGGAICKKRNCLCFACRIFDGGWRIGDRAAVFPCDKQCFRKTDP
jgi:glycosyltransferase involved in cell wall biosynthesis